MISRIARHELLAIVRDGRLRWLMATVAMLFATAVAAGWLESDNARHDREAAAAAMRARWLGQDARHPHAAAHDGIYVFPPRAALSFFDPGVDGHTGQAVWLEAHRQNPPLYRPGGDVTGATSGGPLTPAAVLQLIVPLLIMVLAARSFAAERESGILQSAVSTGADPRRLFVGKALGLAVAIACAIGPGLFVATGIALLRAPDLVAGEEPARAAVAALAWGLYLAIVLVAGLAVSARARTARHALVWLLGGWTAMTFVVPRVAGDAIAAAWPLPSIIGFTRVVETERAAAFNAHTAAAEERDRVLRSLLARHRVSRVEDLPADVEGLLLQADEEAGHRVFDRQWGLIREQLEAQDRAYARVAILSPPLAIRLLSMALASTDGYAHLEFVHAAERYRRTVMAVLHGDVMLRARAQGHHAGPANLWAKVPPFRHATVPLRTTIRQHGWSLLALVAWLTAAAGAAAVALRRLDAAG